MWRPPLDPEFGVYSRCEDNVSGSDVTVRLEDLDDFLGNVNIGPGAELSIEELLEPVPLASQQGRAEKVHGEQELSQCDPMKCADIDLWFSKEDIELASVPGRTGGRKFNPKMCKFDDDELRPRPPLGRSKRTFVPERNKDSKYWQNRQKNNIASKRSRDAKRIRENQILLRLGFLEKENAALRERMIELERDNRQLRSMAQKLQ